MHDVNLPYKTRGPLSALSILGFSSRKGQRRQDSPKSITVLRRKMRVVPVCSGLTRYGEIVSFESGTK